MKYLIFSIIVMIGSLPLSAQNIAINTTGTDPDGSALLDIQGTNHGLLVPRVSLTATTAAGPVTSPAVSLLVYNTATVSDVTPGYYYWNGTAWVRFFDGAVNGADHDWYAVGGTSAPTSINDDIFTQGDVGIGTTAPVYPFQVNKRINLDGNYWAMAAFTNPGVQKDGIWIGSNSSTRNAGIIGSVLADGAIDFATFNGTTHDTRFSILGNGNVGVGTTNPKEKLEVDGNIRIGGNDTANYIAFHGTTGDQPGSFNHGYIGEHLYSGTEASELLIFKGNDHEGNSSGSDRIRIAGNNIVFDTYESSPLSGTFQNVAKSSDLTTKMIIRENGNVGIGTIAPTSALHVVKNPGNGDNTISLVDLHSTETGATGTQGAQVLRVRTSRASGMVGKIFSVESAGGSVDYFNVQGNGRVGIGTTSPSTKFQVNGSIRMVDGNEAAGKILVSDANGKGSWQAASSISPSSMEDADGDTKIQLEETSDEDDIRFDTKGVERMIIDENGNVGIGTTAPVTSLTVNNSNESTLLTNFTQSLTNTGLLIETEFTASSYTPGIFWSTSNNNSTKPKAGIFLFEDNTGSDMYFGTSSSYTTGITNTGMVLDQSGNLGIGTTAPASGLDIATNRWISGSSQPQLTIRNTRAAIGLFDTNEGTDNTFVLENGEGNFDIYTTPYTADDFGYDERKHRLRIQKNTGNVGIGTTTPVTSLTVNSSDESTLLTNFTQSLTSTGLLIETEYTANAYTPGIFWSTSNNNNTKPKAGIFLLEDNTGTDMYFGTSNNYATGITNTGMVLDQSGNVGIGTTSPSAELTIIGNGGVTSGLDLRSPRESDFIIEDNTRSQMLLGTSNTGESAIDFGDESEWNAGEILYGHNKDYMAFRTNNVEQMRVDSFGNVGIGTTAPEVKLHVDGTVRASRFEFPPDRFGGSGDKWWIENKRNSGEQTYLEIGTSNDVSDHISLMPSGYVGIGTTTPEGGLHLTKSLAVGTPQLILDKTYRTTSTDPLDNSPLSIRRGVSYDQSLNIFQQDQESIFYLRNDEASSRFVFILDNTDTESGGGAAANKNTVMSIIGDLSGGRVGIGTTAPTEKLHVIGNILASGTITSSDERYKKDVMGIENASAIIERLRPVSYLFRTNEFEGQFDEKKHYGVIAQEIEKVLPELVYTDDKGYKAVNYTDLISVLLKGIQEQQVLINENSSLKDKVAAQEEKFTKQIEELKSLIMNGQKQ